MNVRVNVFADLPPVFWKLKEGGKPDSPPFPHHPHPAPNPIKPPGNTTPGCPAPHLLLPITGLHKLVVFSHCLQDKIHSL